MPHVQVRIGKNLDHILIYGMDLQGHIAVKNRTHQYSGRKAIQFNCQGSWPQQKGAVLLASLSSPTGLISWEDQRYRGDLQVITSENFSSCDLIQKASMEDYISSLLAKEMHGHWPVEALKAQAVAARTYALVKKQESVSHLFTLENTEKHQVSGSFFDETSITRRASIATKGLILVNKRGHLTPAFFHSKCGGETYLPQQVWSDPIKSYRSVKCPFCHGHGTRDWTKSISRRRLQRVLKRAFPRAATSGKGIPLQLMADQKNRDSIRFFWGGKIRRVKKSYLRKQLGRKQLPSNNFTIFQRKNRFFIKGRGLGHGVGMCQFGALEMARQGKNHRQILAHYYPQLKIKKLY